MRILLPIFLVLAVAVSFFAQGRGSPDAPFGGRNSSNSTPATIQEDTKRQSAGITEQAYKEIKKDASELAVLSSKVSDQINANDRFVASVDMPKDLERIEKLAKKLRGELAKK
jgi:hypothetical protein